LSEFQLRDLSAERVTVMFSFTVVDRTSMLSMEKSMTRGGTPVFTERGVAFSGNADDKSGGAANAAGGVGDGTKQMAGSMPQNKPRVLMITIPQIGKRHRKIRPTVI
jgi:hypothetical protein